MDAHETAGPQLLDESGQRAAGEILALFGFARKHVRHHNAIRRYLTDAIFPFCIIHQITIVVAGYYLDQIGLPVWIEAPALNGAPCSQWRPKLPD